MPDLTTPAVRRLTRRLRHSLDPRAADRVRSVLLVWGRLTWRARMSPDILVVGAQRTGTTTLFRLLSEHPDLLRPTVWKGTGYFDDDYHRGPAWYRAHFPLRRPGHVGGGRIRTFECSGYYLFHPLAAQRIARDLPAAQVVVLVRDPVERARSAHRHEVARGFETLSFADAVDREAERTGGEGERLARRPDYRSFAHRHHAYLARGQYAEQVARLVAALGPERVRVVDSHRLFADPGPELLRLQRALGLTPWLPAHVGRHNERPAPPAAPEVRDRLLREFEDSDRALAVHLGRLPQWRDPVRQEPVHREVAS